MATLIAEGYYILNRTWLMIYRKYGGILTLWSTLGCSQTARGWRCWSVWLHLQHSKLPFKNHNILVHQESLATQQNSIILSNKSITLIILLYFNSIFDLHIKVQHPQFPYLTSTSPPSCILKDPSPFFILIRNE